MMKFEDAERIFTKSGFWTKIIPFIWGYYFMLVGALIGSDHKRFSSVTFWLICAVLFIFVNVWQMANFETARTRHEEFKVKYKHIYKDLVESKKIPLTASAILLTRSPGRFEYLLAKAARGE